MLAQQHHDTRKRPERDGVSTPTISIVIALAAVGSHPEYFCQLKLDSCCVSEKIKKLMGQILSFNITHTVDVARQKQKKQFGLA